MAHKKGQGSSRNGRDSNSQRLGVKRARRQHRDGWFDPRAAAWPQVRTGPERRPRQGRHPVRQGRRQGAVRRSRPARPAYLDHPCRVVRTLRGRRPAGRSRLPCSLTTSDIHVERLATGGRGCLSFRPREIRPRAAALMAATAVAAAPSTSSPRPPRTPSSTSASIPSSRPATGSTGRVRTARARRRDDVEIDGAGRHARVPPQIRNRRDDIELLADLMHEGREGAGRQGRSRRPRQRPLRRRPPTGRPAGTEPGRSGRRSASCACS